MKPVLLSTAYLPPISWMALAMQSGNIRIEIHETYPKQTFRNRCRIATSSGILGLTVPVNRTNGNHTITRDIGIDNSKGWQLLHWRSIITAYNKTPYFLFYRDLFEPLYLKKQERLIDFNRELFTVLLKGLQARNVDLYFTDQYEISPDSIDMRNCFHPRLSPRQGITLGLPRYIQAFESNHGFIPDLSIIDLLFNLGPDALPYLAEVKFNIPDQINVLQDTLS